MTSTPPIRRRKPSEEGYILVVVMFMLAIFVIAMGVAAPKIARSIQRDREVETMHRGKQYARAIKLYYKQFNAYPPNVDALVKTNEIRFLRKKYIDPTTGKDEWKVIHLGQNKAPTVMGFFGVPLGGVGAGGGLCGNALPSSTPGSGSSGSSGTPSGGSGFSSGGSGGGFGSTSPTAGCPTDGSSSGDSGSTHASGGASSGTPATGTPAAGGSSTPGTATGLSGQTFGGAGIMGFSPNSPKQSILVYKKKNHYNEWEFVYDPIAEQMLMQGGGGGAATGLNPAGTGTPATGAGATSAPTVTTPPLPQ
jgi:type II secretory pathway pseudopilin PulG